MFGPSKGVLPIWATLMGCASLGNPEPLQITERTRPPSLPPLGPSSQHSVTPFDDSHSRPNPELLAAEVAILRASLLHQKDVTDALRRHIEMMEKAMRSGLTSDLPTLSALVPKNEVARDLQPVALDVPTLPSAEPSKGALGFEELSSGGSQGAVAHVVPHEDPETLWEEAARVRSLGDPGQATVLLRTLERNTPNWEKGDAVQHVLGECALELKQYPLAVSIARGFYPKYPQSPLVPNLKLIEAQGLEGQGNTAAAVRLNIEVIQMSPRSQVAQDAHQALQRLRETL